MLHAAKAGPVLRALAVLGVGAALAVVAPGCSAEGTGEYFGTTERVGKELTTFYSNNAAEPEYLDPGMAHDTASSTLIYQMFEGLTQYDAKDTHPTQAVATRWDQSDDNQVFRFYLRPDAKWSDGKQVTAHDFEYAWKRILRPKQASQGAVILYPILNAELFNRGKLKVVSADVTLLSGPRADAPVTSVKLTKGAPVVVLGRSPMKVSTAIAPFAAPPAAKLITYTKADPKKSTPEQLSFGAARPAAGPDENGGWRDAEVAVLRRGAAVDCDEKADYWYEITRDGAARGYLPGCLLQESAGARGKGFALVARHGRMPTFAPAPAADPAGAAEPPVEEIGFVSEEQLVEDTSVIGVRAKDDLTLDVELEQPTPYFTDITSHTSLFPVRKDVIEAWAAKGKEELWIRPENIVTNGPYVLDDWRFRYEITMKRNPYHYDHDKLKLHRLVYLNIEEHHSTMNLYKAGDIDFIGDQASLPTEYLAFLKTKKDFRQFFYVATYWYEFNVKKPPVDDVRVRRALNLAVDKALITAKITRGGQPAASHYIPDFTGLGYDEHAKADKAAGVDPFATPDTVFNPARAREILKEAGYEVVKDGDGYRASNFPSLEILYNTSEGHKQIAVAIQDMWKQHLGVSATLRNEEWKVMLKNVRDGNFHVARFGWVADYNHPHTFMATFLSYSPNNRTGWADKEFDELVRKASATADPKESIKQYRIAEKAAVDGMAKMPLYFYTKSSLMKPWVKGFRGNGRNVTLMKWLWIDPSWRSNPSNEPAFPSIDFPTPGRIAAAGPETPPPPEDPAIAPPPGGPFPGGSFPGGPVPGNPAPGAP